ncbi:MAG: ABC transporter ATP-binding protein [Chloroflexota bacterium]|jgi:putative ABC transport system ATP-binding protein|nr:ABC transporter ATP-binding protein [Candidatus Sulfotelmatobacter sp.]
MIKTEKLTKIYNPNKKNQVEAVKDVNITVKEGQITALVGPSGCGKTTLMSMIGQLLTATSGKVMIDGEDLSTYSDNWRAVFRRKNIGFIFQHINLLPNLNALENVMTPLICHDVNLSDYEEKALKLLSDLGLQDRSLFSVEQLSGGQQQRVAVARALITEPKIIIADEPLTFVDDSSAQQIISSFNKLRDEGKTILISTHLSSMAKIADQTYRMQSSKII